MSVRVPKIITEVQELNPDYAAPIQESLDALRQSLEAGAPIPMIDLPAPDHDDWTVSYATHKGHTWLNTDWFFAEIFFYRHLIQAVRWWETGRDPFAPKKAAELASHSLWELVEQALLVDGKLSVEERLFRLIHSALWGNRIDLSFPASLEHGQTVMDEDLLVDDALAAIQRLLETRGVVHIIADNTGSELAMDLVLADALLNGVAERVIFHVKVHPTFVSDATPADVLTLLGKLESGHHGDAAKHLGKRLRTAHNTGRLRIAPDLFWNSSYFLSEIPPRLSQTFQNAVLVIVKGDLNYRRTVCDSIWPEGVTFADATSYFPAPLLALRTLKSDPLVGLPPGRAQQLDNADALWRVNGRRGVIQYKP
jgi:hypothetical protein